MAFPKGAARPEGAGRKKGTPNHKTQHLMNICEKEGIDPFQALCQIAKESIKTNPERAISALKEVCQYVYPKRKALEIELSDEELIDLAKERLDEVRASEDS